MGRTPWNTSPVAVRPGSCFFYRSTRNNLWRVVDVTAKTGRSIAGGLTDWQTPDGSATVEHLAARDATGRLLVFFWSPAADWQVVDVTAKTGQQVRADVTSWQVRRDGRLYEYLAAASAADNTLLVFSWAAGAGLAAQQTYQVSPDGATPWLTGTSSTSPAWAPTARCSSRAQRHSGLAAAWT
jgi:hypothetical protein